MPYSVFHTRCAHRVLAKLEQCPDCVASARAAAVAKAGPQERKFSYVDTSGRVRYAVNRVKLTPATRNALLDQFFARQQQTDKHTSKLAIECKCDYCTDIRASMGVERRDPMRALADMQPVEPCDTDDFFRTAPPDAVPVYTTFKREYLGHWCEPGDECCAPAMEVAASFDYALKRTYRNGLETPSRQAPQPYTPRPGDHLAAEWMASMGAKIVG